MKIQHAERTSAAQAGAQYLTFLLGKEVFAMDIRTVREIIQFGPMTTVPLMPDFVRGVINLRGAVVPVIDLHARFGNAAAQIGKKTCIVIFDTIRQDEHVELGLLVDAVSGVHGARGVMRTAGPARSAARVRSRSG